MLNNFLATTRNKVSTLFTIASYGNRFMGRGIPSHNLCILAPFAMATCGGIQFVYVIAWFAARVMQRVIAQRKAECITSAINHKYHSKPCYHLEV